MARRWSVFLLTSTAAFMALLDVTVVNIAFPDLRRTFGDSSLADLSWVLNAYNVVFAAALVPAGRLADRLGRRRVFLVGVVVFLAASVACGLASSLELLVAARVVQALGAAIILPTSLSLLLPEFPVARRMMVTSLWTATGAVAAVAGPSLGGLLVGWQGWRWIFFVNLLIGLPLLLRAAVLRESRDESVDRWPDAVGAALLALAVGALALALVKGDDWGWSSPGVVAGMLVSIAAFLAFAVRSANHPEPVIEPALLRIRSFAVASLGSLIFGAGFFAMLLGNVLFLTGVWGYGVATAGLALLPGPIAAALNAPVAGRLAERFGPRAIAVPGGLLFAAGALLLATRTTASPNYLVDFLPAATLAGIGVGLSLAAFGSAAVAEIPRTRFATGVALSSCMRQLGAVVGVAGLVAVVGATSGPDSLASFHRGYQLIAVVGVLAATCAVALGRVRARDVPGSPSPTSSPGYEPLTNR